MITCVSVFRQLVLSTKMMPLKLSHEEIIVEFILTTTKFAESNFFIYDPQPRRSLFPVGLWPVGSQICPNEHLGLIRDVLRYLEGQGGKKPEPKTSSRPLRS